MALKIMRTSKEFQTIVNYIRARYIMEGKTPPSITHITRVIAKKINKEDLLRNEFIRF